MNSLILILSLIVLVVVLLWLVWLIGKKYSSHSEPVRSKAGSPPLLRPITASDGLQYYVVNGQTAADELAEIRKRIIMLCNHLDKNPNSHPGHQKYLAEFSKKAPHVQLVENQAGYGTTSYTINKGDRMALCLKNVDGTYHDINVNMYIALHEYAHVACPELEHTDLFYELLSILLKTAESIDIYDFDNYAKNPAPYCGITISEDLTDILDHTGK